MEQGRWKRLNDIFDKAIELPAGQQTGFVKEACAGDDELHCEVLELIQHATETIVKDQNIINSAARSLVEHSDHLNQQIGQYKIVRKLGAGGMGDVYLAQRADGEFDQEVAIKIVHGGAQSQVIIERFRAERQILAGLKHPNIAQLLDGGVSEAGQLYFAMEYVDGLPIDEYCDNTQLTIAARISLFSQVCDAITYAHANLVVHRDLKPSNILVTTEGQVKLLDFGIAKVIGDESHASADLTRTGMSVMTPSYASPEQALGKNITTASDVYSLGVILYELLGGQRPYEVATHSPVEAANIICSVQPQRLPDSVTVTQERTAVQIARMSAARATGPKRLRRLFAGDLDMICQMALRKEPERRYVSAHALGKDLQRHLEGRPVQARAESWSYLTAKFIRRNRVGVASSVTIFALISTLVGAFTYRLTVARDEAEAVTVFLTDFLATADPSVKGVNVRVLDVIDAASEKVAKDFADDPRTRARIQYVLGSTYFSLNRFDQAREQLRPALATHSKIFGPAAVKTRQARNKLVFLSDRGSAEHVALMADAVRYRPAAPDEHSLGIENLIIQENYHLEGNHERTLELYEELTQKSARYLGEEHNDTVRYSINAATVLMDLSRYAEAEARLLDSIRINEKYDDRKTRVGLAKLELGLLYGRQEKYDKAIPVMEDVVDFNLQLYGPDTQITAVARGNLAEVYSFVGRYDEAVAMIQLSIDSKIRLFGEEEGTTLIGFFMQAGILESRDFDAASIYYEKAISGAMTAWPEGHWRIGQFHEEYGRKLFAANRSAEALQHVERGMAEYKKTPHPDPEIPGKTASLLADIRAQLASMNEGSH